MRPTELRIRDDFGDEYVVLYLWHADSFAEESGLEPLDGWSARSKISWWVRGRGPIADVLIQHILKPSPHGVFLPNAAEQAVEDAFRSSWKLFKLPRPERKPVKIAEDAAGATEKYVPPPPPPATTEEKSKTWFEVKVVDEFGKAIDGLEVVFSQGSRQETFETNGAGIVRWKDVEGPSFASVKVANVATLRDLLKPRYAKGGERKMPDGADVTKVMLGLEDPGKALSAETPGILVIAKPLTRVRLIGMHFDTNKCFLREPAMHGIRKVVSVYKANPTGKLLIVGHTDTVDTEAYNLDLSVERAEAVKAYLKDDVAAWEAWFGDGKPEKKRWGSREINEMIKALPCEKSVKDFQQWSNDNRGTDLKVDGIAGPKTRKALIEAYMALDGTTLPKSIDAVVHGCGEFFPRMDEKDQYGKDNVEAQENRRVEMFCFDDEIQPPVPGKKATKGEPEYPQWQKQVTNNVDLSTADYVVARVRLCCDQKNPIPHAPCRVTTRPGETHSADAGGWIEIVIGDEDAVTLRWARPESPEQYDYSQTLSIIRDAEDEDVAGEARLRNLGFTGETVKELVQSYQASLARSVTGVLDDIRDELWAWHDGGTRPSIAL